DTSGNTATGSFSITVRDTTAPVVTVPADITAEATSAAGATVNYGVVKANDIVDGTVTPACSALSGQFPLGATTITCTAKDAHGNSAQASFTVTIRNTTAPAL